MKSKNKFWRAAVVMALLTAWVSIPFVSSNAKTETSTEVVSGIDRWANLVAPSGAVSPRGIAEWELKDDGRREIEINVDALSLAAGTALTAVVDNGTIGTLFVNGFGHAELRLRTQDGQTVPNVAAGSTVEVRNGSAIVVSGVFVNGPAPSPSPSVSPSPSPSTSPTASPSPSGSPSPSPSVSPTASPSPTGSPSPSPSVSPSPSPSPGNPGDLFAGLTGPTLNGVLPGGFAQFEIHSSRVELEVRVRQINLPAGTSLNVSVNGNTAGNMTLESGGEARLRLRSDTGQTVPVIVVGSTITVNNGGSAILSGVFAGSSATPSPSPSPSGSPSPSPSPSPTSGRSFEAHLNGGQVTPPVTTIGSGEIKVTLNTAENQATVFGEFHNLSSSQTGARLETTVGSTTTIRDLGIVGGRNGNFASATFNVSAVQVQQLRAGLWSAVITSVNSPNGEIRGALRQRSSESDFDGDGSHDLAVFRPSTGTWFAANDAGSMVLNFGSEADRIVSGDYDGDGKTDIAVYKNAAGQGVWEIKRSSDGGVTTASFGLATDIPVRGDFDGDGRLDYAVFRASTGTWYVQKSNNTGNIVMQFGLSGDKPMPADMDGDGRDDIAVFRASEGNWYWVRSSDGQFAGVHWGQNGDVPVSGDFDGDGKADTTVFRPSTSIWYTFRSSDGQFSSVYFGLAGDVPVAGNYDGDGRTDIAVFRPSDGNWYILRSTDGSYLTFHFGLNGDVPLIAR